MTFATKSKTMLMNIVTEENLRGILNSKDQDKHRGSNGWPWELETKIWMTFCNRKRKKNKVLCPRTPAIKSVWNTKEGQNTENTGKRESGFATNDSTIIRPTDIPLILEWTDWLSGAINVVYKIPD